MKYYDLCYRNNYGIPEICIFGRNEKKEKTIKRILGVNPSFYILTEEKYKLPLQDIITTKDGYKSIFNDDLTKVWIKKPSVIYYMRDLFSKTFEADTTFVNRYILDVLSEDKNFEYGEIENFRVFIMDIETRVENSFPDPITALEQITCATIHDSYENIFHTFIWKPDFTNEIITDGEKKLYKFNDEVKMLEALINFISTKQPDIISGWNLILFDLSYILKRCENLNISYTKLSPINNVYWRTSNRGEKSIKEPIIQGVVLLDLLEVYKRFQRGEMVSYSLASIAKAEKIKTEKQLVNTEILWLENWEKLVNYNIDDVKMVIDIDKKRELLKFLQDVRKFGNVRFEDVKYFSRVIDSILLKKAQKDNIILPSKPKLTGVEYNKLREERELKGAYVYTTPGLYKNVVIYDFSKLYVSIIRTLNLSPEVIKEDGNIKLENVNIDETKEGIIPSLIEYLLTAREQIDKKIKETDIDSDEYKHLESRLYTIKCLVLAAWGVISNPLYRLYDIRLASNITRTGRELAKVLHKTALDNNYNVAFEDTDSAAVVFPENYTEKQVFEECEILLKKFNEACNNYILSLGVTKKHYITLDIEKFYKTLLVLTKKKYVGYLNAKMSNNGWKKQDAIELVGVEGKKSNYSMFAHELQKKIFDIILKQQLPKDYVINYIITESKKMFNLIHGYEYISIPEKLNKSPKEYATTLPRLRGVFWSNKNIKTNYKSGSKFLTLFVKHTETDAICFEYDEQLKNINFSIDKKKMFERNVYLVLDKIFEVLNWQADLEKIKKLVVEGQTSLESFR